jgi:hypothetical protein
LGPGSHMKRLLIRVLRWCRWVVPGILLLLLLAMLSVLLAPVRESLLAQALARAGDRLPGQLRVQEAVWPQAGRVEIRDLLWTLESDTLLAARRVVLDADVRALLGKEFLINELAASGVRADVPGLQKALADTAATPPPPGDPVAALFDRLALPALPSLAVALVDLQVDRVDLAPESRLVAGRLVAGLEMRHQRTWWVKVDTVRCATLPAAWAIHEGRITWDQEQDFPRPACAGGSPRVGR